ncbi:MAG: alpha/beta fold hydrolase, partial [Candidatus Dormibacteria bacterium]
LQALLASGILGTERPPHLLGWSMGAGVALQYVISHPEQVASVILESPMSPFGFGGTKDPQGTPCWPDFAGSGGGAANPELVQRLAAGDRGGESDLSPRRIMRSMYMNPAAQLPQEWEEALLSSMLATVIGDRNYPGESIPSANWPHVSPGRWGVLNALSPKYCDLSGLADLQSGPDLLWIRGSDDLIVSDTSLSDIGYLGQLGAVPGWPGAEVFPPQPMVAQTRAVLERYRKSGARVEERVMAGSGHSPHLERPEEFAEMVRQFLLERG